MSQRKPARLKLPGEDEELELPTMSDSEWETLAEMVYDGPSWLESANGDSQYRAYLDEDDRLVFKKCPKGPQNKE